MSCVVVSLTAFLSYTPRNIEKMTPMEAAKVLRLDQKPGSYPTEIREPRETTVCECDLYPRIFHPPHFLSSGHCVKQKPQRIPLTISASHPTTPTTEPNGTLSTTATSAASDEAPAFAHRPRATYRLITFLAPFAGYRVCAAEVTHKQTQA